MQEQACHIIVSESLTQHIDSVMKFLDVKEK